MSSQITKILIRKGLNADRKTFTLSQAESGYTTDTKRVYIGDGTTAGGIPVSVVNWGIQSNEAALLTLNAEVNDIAFVTSKTYALTASPASNANNWAIVSGKADGTVTNIGLGDYLNVDGDTLNKSLTATGTITLEVNSLIELIYPIGSVYITTVPYIDANTSTSVFENLGSAGNFGLKSGSYVGGVWNYINSDTIASATVYVYERVS